MLTIKRLFIVCNRETFAVLFLYVQDGVSEEAGLLRGWHGSGAVLSRGTLCLPLPLLLCLTWARGAARGTRLAAQVALGVGVSLSRWRAGVGLLSPVPLSLHACGVSQAVNSRKLPGRHMEGVGWGGCEPRASRCVCRDKEQGGKAQTCL